ncbi:MAG: pseudouridine synthase [Chloroflexi bacterium]|nr:pseudouridine synthase [Chloroflexota bacterium]
MSEERVQKILARSGYGSRRSCEELIISGRIRINGEIATLGKKADSQVDKIMIDGKLLPSEKPLRYMAYNKPRFVLCDKVYGDSRRTIFDLVEGGQELVVVGRLDFESEGLVILTNDGDLVNRLTHPKYQHEKEYRVLLASHPDVKQLEVWRRGVVLEDGHKTSPANVTVESTAGKGAWIRVVLKEGHKRQIRETAKMTGLFVVKLIRTRIATLKIGPLKSGESRNLTIEEVAALKDTTKPGRKIGFVKDNSKVYKKREKSVGEKTYKKFREVKKSTL